MKLPIHNVETNADRSVDVMYRGGVSDYDYIAGCLNNRKGVTVSQLDHKADGTFLFLRVRGTGANPVTEAHVLAMFEADPQIELRLGSNWTASGTTTTDNDSEAS